MLKKYVLCSLFVLINYICFNLTYSIFNYLSSYSNIILITIKAEETFYALILIYIVILIYMSIPLLILFFLFEYQDALKDNELKIFKILPLFYLCGLGGSIFGFYIGVHYIVPFFLAYNELINIDNFVSLSNIIKNALYYSFAFFIIFQLPMIVKILKDNNIVEKSKLINNRGAIFLISLIIGAIFSPVDFWSMVILSIPMYLSFEIGLWI